MLLGKLTPALALLLLPGLGGCFLFDDNGNDPGPDCMLTAGLEAQIVYADSNGKIHVAADEPMIPVQSAPQGGHILLVGVQLKTTANGCAVAVNAALRDLGNGRVVGLEERPVPMRSGASGWSGPPNPAGLADLTNIAVCPSSAASTAIVDHPFQLEVRASAGGTVLAQVMTTVTPTCADDYCRSDCAMNASIPDPPL